MANKPGRIDDDPAAEQSTVNEPKNSEDASKTVIPESGIEQKSPDADEAKDDHVFIRPDDLHLKSDEVHEPKPNDLAKLFAGSLTVDCSGTGSSSILPGLFAILLSCWL